MILRAQPSMAKCQKRTQSCYIQVDEEIVIEGELLAVSRPAEVVDASTEADLKCQAISLEVAASSNPSGTDHTPVAL